MWLVLLPLPSASLFLLYFATLLFPLAVAATEVECIREGCQSEALRGLSGSVQDKQCFTVVFRGARKSLDLVCSSEAEAQCWVRGLRTLKEYVANMTQKEKLDQYPAQSNPVDIALLRQRSQLPVTLLSDAPPKA